MVVELDAGLLEAEALDVGAAPGGDHEVVDLRRLVAVGEAARSSSPGSTFSTSVLVKISMPCFLIPRSTTLEMSASSVGSTRSSASNSMHLAAEPRVGRGDLGARRAGADHGDRAGQLVRAPTPPRCPTRGRRTAVPGIGFGTEPVARIDRLGLDLVAVELAADAHVAVGGHRAVALDDVDLVLLEQAARRRRSAS